MLDNLIGKFHDIKAKRENGEGGFTLIELLVVVVIIGILIAIAIPLYLNYQKGANDKSSQSDLRAAVSALQQCYSENGNSYPTVLVDTAATPAALAATTAITGAFQFKCGATNTQYERVNLSDGTKLHFTNSTGTVVMTTWNPDGKKNADTTGNNYSYDSSAGGTIK